MDKSAKLAQVRKSCNILEIVFKVVKIICIVGACICLVASILFGIFGNKVVSFSGDEFYSNAKIDLHVFDNEVFSYENGEITGPLAPIIKQSIEKSIKDELGTNATINFDNIFNGDYGPKAVDLLNGYVKWGMFVGLIFAAGMCALVAVLFWLIEGIFKQIKESDSPFTEAVLKKLRIVFICVPIIAFLTNGIWAGLIVALLCWAIYCIIDYGYALQIEVDETL